MNRLLNLSLKRFILYASLILAAGIPIYYFAIRKLWQYELQEHHVVVTPEAGREDSILIISAVTGLSVIFFLLLLGGFVLINRRITRQLWQPFYDTLERIKQFDLNKQQAVQFEPTDIAEFAALNDTLDKLLSANMATYHQQKEFAENASHELQTPLAIIQSKLEVLLQSQSLTDQQFEVIEEALTALSRVSRINKNLLLLTKLENSQYGEQEDIALSALVKDTTDLLDNLLENKKLQLTTKIHESMVVHANKILVEILIQNLFSNAIRHSNHGASVNITLNQEALHISNEGTASLHTDRLFKRFTTAGSRSPGTGLGLAIVKQIADRYGWTVTYRFNAHTHTFSVYF